MPRWLAFLPLLFCACLNVPPATGDATTAPFKQIVTALGDGAKAALGAFEHWVRASAPAA